MGASRQGERGEEQGRNSRMIVLDYNIIREQAQLLKRRRIHFRQIGVDIGLPSWDDQQEILRYLHCARQITFFTRDDDFFRYKLCHSNYCLAVINAPEYETAAFITKFLRYPDFKTKARRCGKVVKLSPRIVTWWEPGKPRRQHLVW